MDDGIAGLSTNITLLDMRLDNYGLDENDLAMLVEGLRHNTTLTTLSLKYNTVSMIPIFEALHHNTTLLQLDLSFNDILNTGAEAAAKMLGVNASLTSLNLSCTDILASGVSSLARALETNATLTYLNLTDADVKQSGARGLARMLKVNTSLNSLVLNNIKSSTGFEIGIILEALKHNSSLTFLSLDNDAIDEAGVKTVTELLRLNTSLSRLHLGVTLFPETSDSNMETEIVGALSYNGSLVRFSLIPKAGSYTTSKQRAAELVTRRIVERNFHNLCMKNLELLTLLLMRFDYRLRC